MMRRRDVRRMRPIKADGEEERLAGFVRMILLQQLDGSQGSLAIGVILIFAIDNPPAQCAAIGSFAQGSHRIQFHSVDSYRVHHLVPGRLVILAIGSNLQWNAIVINFPHTGGKVSMLHEMLREGGQFRVLVTKVSGIGKYACLLRIQPSHERRPARVADRILAVRLVEPQPAFGQPIHIGRVHQRMPIAAKVGIEVIHGDEQDIGRGGVNGGRGQDQ